MKDEEGLNECCNLSNLPLIVHLGPDLQNRNEWQGIKLATHFLLLTFEVALL
jgi:hypothetical protein